MQRQRPANDDSNDESTKSPPELEFLRASEHPAQGVEWLWPNRIPIGKVTLLVGDPGTGKSLIALDIAARVSRAAPWPDKEPGAEGTRHGAQLPNSPLPAPGSVLILSADDELADTIRPRLDAAGAKCKRIFFLPSVTDLRNDFAQLRAAVNRAPDCRLIVIDPVNAYVGPSDSHFQTIVRRVLEPLARLASRKRIAVLAVAHLRKTDGAALYRAAGSMGFVATARAVWTVCRDPANLDRCMLLPLKNNLAAASNGLEFAIRQHGRTAAPAIDWNPRAVTTPAANVLASFAKKRGPEAVELEDASDWLRQALSRGPRSASELTEAAEQCGFHVRTLRRALHVVGGTAHNRGIPFGWWWSLPERAESCPEGTPEKPVPFKKTCPLPGIFDDRHVRPFACELPVANPTSL